MDGIALEALGGMQDREIDRQALGAKGGAVAEDQLSENDGMAQSLFRIVIRRRQVVDFQEGEEPVIVALRVEQALAEVFRFGMMACLFADAA